MMTARSTVMEALRSGTRDSHYATDHHPVMARLLEDSVSPEHYTSALVAMYGLQSSYETTVLPLLPSNFHQDLRCPSVLEDLQRLGCSNPKSRPSLLNPHLNLIGVAYVVEGSRLGSKVIARLLKERAPQLPVSYFESGFVSGRWEQFSQFAEQAVYTEEDLHAAVQAAKFSFAAVYDLLDELK